MGRLVVAAALAATGCHALFGLDEVDRQDLADAALDASVNACVPFQSDDDDSDGVPNLMDRCPFVPDEGDDDEDGDGVPDDCDPCPHLDGPDILRDTDCDGVGDACDPSNDVAHDLTFFSFTGASGLSTDMSTLVGGSVVGMLPTGDGTGGVSASSPVADGVYESACQVRGIEDNVFVHFGLRLETELDDVRARILTTSVDGFEITTNGNQRDFIQRDPMPPELSLRMRMTVTGAQVRVDVFGDISGTVEATLDEVLVPPVDYGLHGYRDGDPGFFTYSCAYLLHVSPAP